jgi:hypothetical protein
MSKTYVWVPGEHGIQFDHMEVDVIVDCVCARRRDFETQLANQKTKLPPDPLLVQSLEMGLKFMQSIEERLDKWLDAEPPQ